MNIKFKEVTNIELGGVDMSDYPDFCDAYVESAEKLDGTPLTEVELEAFEELDETRMYVNENAFETLL
jgi:hypothetical protein|tara:strand:+ start:1119 stop:1322 length:204 start_codon:yes stop_codon:yes gene_type:complete